MNDALSTALIFIAFWACVTTLPITIREFKEIVSHVKLWNEWRKGCLNGPLHKFLVLIGLVYSPTFHVFVEFRNWSMKFPDYTIHYKEGE